MRHQEKSSFRALGIVFLLVGLGLTAGKGFSAGVTFLILGVTFLSLSASLGRRSTPTGRQPPESD